MAGKTRKPKQTTHARITAHILKMLDEGAAPWRQPWVNRAPRSYRGHVYRGINALMLGLANYPDPRWITFNQALSLGGHVRKGEKGMPAIFWRWIDKEDAEGNVSHVAFARGYTVFNVTQCDGLDLPALPDPGTDVATDEQAEALIAGFKDAPEVTFGGNQAFYRPAVDRITLPPRDSFTSMEGYYSTLFHELAHSTGHESRLDRFTDETFTGHERGREELIAEFASSFLCAAAGLAPSAIEQNAAYIAHWKQAIEADERLVVTAAAAGQRAADHVMGVSWEDAAGETEEAAVPVAAA